MCKCDKKKMEKVPKGYDKGTKNNQQKPYTSLVGEGIMVEKPKKNKKKK